MIGWPLQGSQGTALNHRGKSYKDGLLCEQSQDYLITHIRGVFWTLLASGLLQILWYLIEFKSLTSRGPLQVIFGKRTFVLRYPLNGSRHIASIG